jgi:hypothetical protein
MKKPLRMPLWTSSTKLHTVCQDQADDPAGAVLKHTMPDVASKAVLSESLQLGTNFVSYVASESPRGFWQTHWSLSMCPSLQKQFSDAAATTNQQAGPLALQHGLLNISSKRGYPGQ